MSAMQDLLRHEGLLTKMPADKAAQIQGEVFSIYLASKHHSACTINEMAAWVLPAIHFNQFRIYRQGKRPVAWVSWARMSEEDGVAYINGRGDFKFRMKTWTGGDQIWFIDFIAPFGHALKVSYDLKRNVFPNETGFAPDINMETGERRVRKLFGAHVEAEVSEDEADFIHRSTDTNSVKF